MRQINCLVFFCFLVVVVAVVAAAHDNGFMSVLFSSAYSVDLCFFLGLSQRFLLLDDSSRGVCVQTVIYKVNNHKDEEGQHLQKAGIELIFCAIIFFSVIC